MPCPSRPTRPRVSGVLWRRAITKRNRLFPLSLSHFLSHTLSHSRREGATCLPPATRGPFPAGCLPPLVLLCVTPGIVLTRSSPYRPRSCAYDGALSVSLARCFRLCACPSVTTNKAGRRKVACSNAPGAFCPPYKTTQSACSPRGKPRTYNLLETWDAGLPSFLPHLDSSPSCSHRRDRHSTSAFSACFASGLQRLSVPAGALGVSEKASPSSLLSGCCLSTSSEVRERTFLSKLSI